MPVEPPTPAAEQLAQWQALVEQIRQGDHLLNRPGFKSRGGSQLLGPMARSTAAVTLPIDQPIPS